MAIKTGTHTIADLIDRQFAGELVMPSNMEAVTAAVQQDLAVHNQRTTEMVTELADVSTERTTVYGTNADGEMHRKDEFTRGPTQKVTVGGKVEFPLDGWQVAVGWTADYLRRASVRDVALNTVMARNAHLRAVQTGIKEAFFGATNYIYVDRLVDSNPLTVKRLVNADGAAIPNGPDSETFDGATHTHYDGVDFTAATAAGKATALAAFTQDVIEHGHGSDVRVYINQAQEAEVRMATGFEPLLYPNIAAAEGRATGVLDITRTNNRLIGYFQGIGVWTKPWVPSDYALAFAAGDPGKPLRYRVSEIEGERSGLFMAGEIITHPLQAQYMEAFFGFGAFTRTNGAVLYLGGAAYVEPTF